MNRLHTGMMRLGQPIRGIFSLLLLTMMTTIHAAEAPNPLVQRVREDILGTPAPAMELTTLDGTTIDLREIYGKKAIYLKFWATWCLPCQQQMPHFENVYQHAGDDLEVIALNAGFNETLQNILEFREDFGIHMPIVVDDGALAEAFHLRITPQHIVIGKDGLIKHVGNLADAELDAVIEAERRVPQSTASAVRAGLASRSHLDLNDTLPNETLQVGDKTIRLNDKSANGTVMVFMTPWCESYLAETRPGNSETCRVVREQIESLRQEYPETRWLGVSSGLWTEKGDLARYAAQNKVTLPLSLDASGDLFREFSVMTVPTLIVADAEGRIVSRIEGHDVSLEQIVASLAD